jgi:hypothetical protein
MEPSGAADDAAPPRIALSQSAISHFAMPFHASPERNSHGAIIAAVVCGGRFRLQGNFLLMVS